MSDISVSERRLSAALDRIDQFLDRARPLAGAHLPDVHAELEEAHARIAALTQQMARLGGGDDPDLAQDVARLAAANDALAEANRALVHAVAGDGDTALAVHAALEAEIESLRAARAAEAAQLGVLLAEVERLLAENEAAAASPEIAGDVAGVPEADDGAEMHEGGR